MAWVHADSTQGATIMGSWGKCTRANTAARALDCMPTCRSIRKAGRHQWHHYLMSGSHAAYPGSHCQAAESAMLTASHPRFQGPNSIFPCCFTFLRLIHAMSFLF